MAVFSSTKDSKDYTFHLELLQVSQNQSLNESTVSWKTYLTNKLSTVANRGMTTSATVDGTTVLNNTNYRLYMESQNMTRVVGSGTVIVKHAENGVGSVSASAVMKGNTVFAYGPQGTHAPSGTLNLTTIPRYAAITAFSVSITDLSSTISWTADKKCSYWRWSSNNGATYTSWIYVNAASGSASATTTPGSTYNYKIQVRASDSGLDTTSSTVTKTATLTKSILSRTPSSQALGSDISWSIAESYSAYNHKITYSFGTASGYVLGTSTVTSGSLSGIWTLSNSLANSIPNATSGAGTLTLYTYYGTQLIGTDSETFTATVPNINTFKPTTTISSVSEANASLSGLGSYVTGHSKINVVSTGVGQYGATIVEQKVVISSGGGTKYGFNVTSDTITSSGTITITVTTKDSRGYSNIATTTITAITNSILTINKTTDTLDGGSVILSHNEQDADFTNKLYYQFGTGTAIEISSNAAAAYTWTLPNTLADYVPSSTTGVLTLICKTYYGAYYIGQSTKTFTFTIPNNATFQPTATITSVTEVGSGLGEFVQNKSSMAIIKTGAGKYSATISSYVVKVDGINYYDTVITTFGDVTISVTAIDSRGYSGITTTTRTFYEYYPVRVVTFTAARYPTNQDTDLQSFFNFDIADINNKNSKSYDISYRLVDGAWTSLVTGNVYVLDSSQIWLDILNADKSYEVKLTVSDYYSTVVKTLVIGSAFELINFNASGTGMAFGKVSEDPTGLEIAFATDFKIAPTVNGEEIGGGSPIIEILEAVYPIGAIYLSTISTSPNVLFGFGTWDALEDRFLIGESATYTAGSTGGSETHTHTSAAHVHTMGTHTHSIAAHTHTSAAHTHTIASHSHTVNSHTHTSAAHTHTSAAHTHTSAAHSHTSGTLMGMMNISTAGTIYMQKRSTAWTGTPSYKGGSGSYGTVSNDSNTTGLQMTGSTASTTPGATGSTTPGATGSTTPGATGASAPGTSGVSLTTTSTTPGATGGTSLTTDATDPGDTNSTTPGNTGSTSTLPPYLAVHMWKRIA